MSMEFKIVLGTGSGAVTADDPHYTQGASADAFQASITQWTKELCAVFGGCSKYYVDGDYIMDNGELCTESSLVFSCILFDSTPVKVGQAQLEVEAIAKSMCRTFGEECVLVTRTLCKAELVRA